MRMQNIPEWEQVKGFDTLLRNLNQDMGEQAELSETEKPLIVSGTLLALADSNFAKSYRAYAPEELPKELVKAIQRQLKRAEMGQTDIEKSIQPYAFITAHPSLSRIDAATAINPLVNIIAQVEAHILPFINSNPGFDVIGQFYQEFSTDGGAEKSSGIVLTPQHIADLCCDLARLTAQSRVLDICAGTGRFLLSAMTAMSKQGVSEAEGTPLTVQALIGVEQNPELYALCASNMIVRDWKNATLLRGDCFSADIVETIRKLKPNVGLINPPYGEVVSKGGRHELEFVEQMLDLLEPNSTGIAIVPLSCATQSSKAGASLLRHHRLEAVISMPHDLFHKVSIATCIMVFIAHVAHDADEHHQTWLTLWDDAGLMKVKTAGHVDDDNGWDTVTAACLEAYGTKAQIAGKSVNKRLTATEEWCAEAHIEWLLPPLKDAHFADTMRDYIVFRTLLDAPYRPDPIALSSRDFAEFTLGELFRIKRGKRFVNGQIVPGSTPLVRARRKNNGVYALIKKKPQHPGNTITVSADGSVGEVFYQPVPHFAHRHVHVLYPRFGLNACIAMFLIRVIKQAAVGFSYNRGLSSKRIKELRIKLPVTSDNTPDWAFMERYIQALPYSKYLVEALEVAHRRTGDGPALMAA